MAEANIQPYIDIIANSSDGDNVRDAIINCMNEINKESKYKVKSKVISGTVGNMETHYVAGSGTVWKDVTLELKLPDGSEVPESQLVVDDFYVDNNTPNDDYPPETGHRWGTIHVNIDWSQYANEDIAEIIEITTDDLDPDSIFHAEDLGYTAARSIRFTNVKSTSGGTILPSGGIGYNVEFKDSNGNYICSAVVPKGDDVDNYYKGPRPADSNETRSMIGWIPEASAKCNRDYTGDNALTPRYSSITFGGDTIADDWDVIGRNGGSKYKIGDHKTLLLSGNNFEVMGFTTKENELIYDPQQGTLIVSKVCTPINTIAGSILPQALEMIKISEDESGCTSSWISAVPLSGIGNVLNQMVIHDMVSNNLRSGDWEDCTLRYVLNSMPFFEMFPNELKPYIKWVTKPYNGWAIHSPAGANSVKQTRDRIWIPSVSEFRKHIKNSFNPEHTQDRYPNNIWTLNESAANYEGSVFYNNYPRQAQRHMYTRDNFNTGAYGGVFTKLLLQMDDPYGFDLESEYFIVNTSSPPTEGECYIGFCL